MQCSECGDTQHGVYSIDGRWLCDQCYDHPKYPVLFLCKHCGRKERGIYTEETRQQLIETQRCFDCNHFLRLVEELPEKDRYVIDGVHYMPRIGDTGPNRWKGHAGAVMTARRLDTGEILENNDWWCQGRIPAAIRHLIPDNAEWVK